MDGMVLRSLLGHAVLHQQHNDQYNLPMMTPKTNEAFNLLLCLNGKVVCQNCIFSLFK